MQGAAGAEGKNNGSPSTAMGKGGGDQSAKKKPRVEPPNAQVKQEILVHEATSGGGTIVAAKPGSGGSRVEIMVKMDMSVLHCPICFRPFKPPVFQCKGGHMACGSCVAEIPDKQCRKCEQGGGGGSGFERCPALDEVVSSTQIECAHDGCRSFVPYHEASEHQSVCPHAPCSCMEPGCGFQAPPPALLAHLTALHAMPVHKVQCGKVSKLQLPAAASSTEPPRRRLLLVEGDDSSFLLTVGGGPAGITAVSAVYIRAGGPPWYTVKMWANGPAPGRRTNRKVEIEATSSAAPGAVDLEELTILTVPRKFLVGAGASKVLPLNVRIDKMSSSGVH